MAESTTKLTIQAQTKGIAEATKEATKLSESVGGVAKKAKGSSSGIKAVMKELREQLKQSTKDADALSAAFIAQSKQLKSLQKQYESVATAVKKTRKERTEDQKEAKAVEAQASIPPPPNTISGHIRQFFGGRPPGGGSSSGGNGPGQGGFAQGFMQAILPQAFIQRGPGMMAQVGGNIAGRLGRDALGAFGSILGSPLSGSAFSAQLMSNIPGLKGLSSDLQQAVAFGHQEAATQRSFNNLMSSIRAPSSRLSAEQSIDLLRSTSMVPGHAFGGLNRNESAAKMAQMAAVGGGYINRYSMSSQREALAASAAYGIDVGTAGIMARGDQLRTTTQGSQASSFAHAIADAISLKLEGSERNQYVDQIAAAVKEGTAQGRNVDVAGIGSIGRMFQATGGYSGVRASALGMGISSTMDQVADGGPQNTGQFLLLQAAGYDPSNPESYYTARERLDNASPNDRARIFEKSRGMMMSGLRGLSRGAKGGAIQEIMREQGVSLRIGSAIKEGQTNLSRSMADDAIALGSTANTQRDAEATARGNTTEASKTLSRIENVQSVTGGKFMAKALSMDDASTQLLGKLSTLGSKFQNLTSSLQDVTTSIVEMTAQNFNVAGFERQVPQ